MAGKQTKQQQQPEVGVKCFKRGRLPAVKLTIDSLSFSCINSSLKKKVVARWWQRPSLNECNPYLRMFGWESRFISWTSWSMFFRLEASRFIFRTITSFVVRWVTWTTKANKKNSCYKYCLFFFKKRPLEKIKAHWQPISRFWCILFSIGKRKSFAQHKKTAFLSDGLRLNRRNERKTPVV